MFDGIYIKVSGAVIPPLFINWVFIPTPLYLIPASPEHPQNPRYYWVSALFLKGEVSGQPENFSCLFFGYYFNTID